MVLPDKTSQTGMTLVEVLVATLILSGGLLGAAAVQLNALKHTDRALMTTQANFVAYDILDRIRANSSADYSYSTPALSDVVIGASGVLGQDLNDFSRNIHQFGGERARGAIDVWGPQVSITVEWDDSRASRQFGSFQTHTLTSQMAADSAVEAS